MKAHKALIRSQCGCRLVGLLLAMPWLWPRRVAVGPVALAQMTGKPIVPLFRVTTRHWWASGWDWMFVPKPFSSGRFVIGASLHVRRGGTRADDRQSLETARQRLAAALNDLGDQAMALATGQTIQK